MLSTADSDSSSEIKSSDRNEVEIVDTIKTTAGSDNRRQSKTVSKSHDFVDLTTTGTPLPEGDPGTGGSTGGSGTGSASGSGSGSSSGSGGGSAGGSGSGSGTSIVIQDGRQYVTSGSETSEFNSETNGGFSFAEWSAYTKRASNAETDPNYWENTEPNGGSETGSAAEDERSTANVYQTVAERTTPQVPSTRVVQGGVPVASEELPGVIYSSIEATSEITYHADGSITAHSEQTTEDRESFDYQILSGGAAGQAVRDGVSGTGQAVTDGSWFGGIEDSIENGSHDLSIVSTIFSDLHSDGTTTGQATTITDLNESSNFAAGATTNAGSGGARHDRTYMSAEGRRSLTLHDELTVTLHADGRESSVRVVERDSFEFSLMELQVTGGDGSGVGAGSNFTMGYGIFVRVFDYDLTEETDVEGTRRQRSRSHRSRPAQG